MPQSKRNQMSSLKAIVQRAKRRSARARRLRLGACLPLRHFLTQAIKTGACNETIRHRRIQVERRCYRFPETGEELPYALAIPSRALNGGTTPLLLALHGLHFPYDWALQLEALLTFASQHAMLVVAPLGYSECGWYGAPDLTEGGRRTTETRRSEADVWHVLDLVKAEFAVDPRHIYAWGFSMGGGGALHLALQRPSEFRGIGLVAPAVAAPPMVPPWILDTAVDLSSISHVAVSILYGTRDRPVPPETTRELIANLKKASGPYGRRLLAMEVAGGRHDCESLMDHGRLNKMLCFLLAQGGVKR